MWFQVEIKVKCGRENRVIFADFEHESVGRLSHSVAERQGSAQIVKGTVEKAMQFYAENDISIALSLEETFVMFNFSDGRQFCYFMLIWLRLCELRCYLSDD